MTTALEERPITRADVRAHGLTTEEYERGVGLLGREPEPQPRAHLASGGPKLGAGQRLVLITPAPVLAGPAGAYQWMPRIRLANRICWFDACSFAVAGLVAVVRSAAGMSS